jgi:hypothetical protein
MFHLLDFQALTIPQRQAVARVCARIRPDGCLACIPRQFRALLVDIVSNLVMLKGRESRLLGLVVHHLLCMLLKYGCSNDSYLGSHVGTSRNRGRQELLVFRLIVLEPWIMPKALAMNLLRRLIRHSTT